MIEPLTDAELAQVSDEIEEAARRANLDAFEGAVVPITLQHVRRLLSDLLERRRDAGRHEQRLDGIQRELDQARAEAEHERSRADTGATELSQVRHELSVATRQLATLRDQRRDQQSAQQGRADEGRMIRRQLERRLTKSRELVSSLQNDLADQQRDAEALREAHARAVSELDQISSELHDSREEHRTSVAALTEQLTVAQATIETLRVGMVTAKNMAEIQLRKVRELEADRAAAMETATQEYGRLKATLDRVMGVGRDSS